MTMHLLPAYWTTNNHKKRKKKVVSKKEQQSILEHEKFCLLYTSDAADD